LVFSCSRAIDGPPEHKDRFAFAGERFLHAALLLLTASVLKYVMLQVDAQSAASPVAGGSLLSPFAVFRFFLGSLVGVLFLFALNAAHTGLRISNQLLWARISRQKDWDDIL